MTDYTYNTGNHIGSTDVRDGLDNLKSFDVLLNSPDETYQDRLGNTVPTAAGAIKRLGTVVAAWTFTTGGTLNYPNEAAPNPADGNYYGWTGEFPKVVAPGTDPTAVTGYVPRTDVVLRDEINVVQRRFSTVAEMKASLTSGDIGKTIEWLGYYNVFDGGGNRGVVVAASTGTDDGGSYITCASGVQVKAEFKGKPKAKQFGAYLDDYNDDTSAYQNFVNYVQSKRIIGEHGAGTAKITAAISFKATYGWGIIGESMTTSYVKQYTDNTPCFSLGNVAADSMHSYLLQELGFAYANVQPSSNTTANPIRFHAMGFEGTFKRLRFDGGSWAIGLVSGIGCPWGQNWDDLIFGSGLRGGAINWAGGVNATPNNTWGRFFIYATNMAGPIFKQVRGYNWAISAIEIVGGTNAQWFDAQAGSVVNILSIKQEIGAYNATLAFNGNALMYFPSGQVLIGTLSLGGTNATYQPLNSLYLAAVTTGTLKIQALISELTVVPSNFYLFNGAGSYSEINYFTKGTNAIPYTNVASTAAADYLKVTPDQNEKLSANKGDADYTISLGDPSVIMFETALTANRTVTIPAGAYNSGGLKYRIISKGAVGTYTLTIAAAGITKATITADNTYVDLVWRRNGTPHAGWVVIGKGVTV